MFHHKGFLPWFMVKDINPASTHHVFRESCSVYDVVQGSNFYTSSW